MAAVVPDPRTIRAFKNAAEFERWLSKHHDKETEVYLRVYKKDSGVETVSHKQALDVALCWGWIDAIRKSYDEQSFLQRFTRRGAKSIWSQINVDNIARLIAEKRMTAHGLAHVEAAKADGRWQAAYAAGSKMVVPDDLLAAIEREPAALATYQRLNAQNRFALAFRLGNLKTSAGREKRIAAFVEMLKRGETLHPNGKGKVESGAESTSLKQRAVPPANRAVARERTASASGKANIEARDKPAKRPTDNLKRPTR
jgi:uncharacterized protein YdeI (YjbR/CyaY-like superfamily)